jgi:hypothetical protein
VTAIEAPPIPEDGSCATCGGDRRPERSRKYGGYEAERDPFCSADCARRWYAAARDVAALAEESREDVA